MGANMALTHANIFVTKLEARSIYMSHHAKHLLAWWRYIADIFLVWTGTESYLHSFHGFLNALDPDVKFTLNHSKKSIQ